MRVWPFGRKQDVEPKEPEPEEETGDSLVDFLDWGIRLGTMGKSERAIEQFKRALAQDPDDVAACYNLALALDQAGRSEEAVEHYRRATELAPDSANITASFGAALIAVGRYEEAADLLAAATETTRDDEALHFNLGCASMRLDRFKDAVNSFRLAVEADPKQPETRFNLAIALRKAGCPDLAENELRDFLALAGEKYADQRLYAQHLLDTEYCDKEIS